MSQGLTGEQHLAGMGPPGPGEGKGTCGFGFHVPGKLAAHAVVVGADVVKAPISELMGTVELPEGREGRLVTCKPMGRGRRDAQGWGKVMWHLVLLESLHKLCFLSSPSRWALSLIP